MTTQVTERYCPICGKAVAEETHSRFGERCCSDAHAEAYAAEVRGEKQRNLAGAERPQEGRRDEMPPRSCCG